MIKTIKCITYDCGNSFEKEKFIPVKNSLASLNKPTGGLWSSPHDSEHSWSCAATSMGVRDLKTSFNFIYTGYTLVIDCLEDLNKIKWIPFRGCDFIKIPDFEDLINRGFDAIHLTGDGEIKTRLTHPLNLYGWDCETVFIMNKERIK